MKNIKNKKQSYIGYLILIIFLIGITLPFYYVFYNNDFNVILKKKFTFSHTILTTESIRSILKEYNNDYKEAMNKDAIIYSLIKNKIIILNDTTTNATTEEEDE